MYMYVWYSMCVTVLSKTYYLHLIAMNITFSCTFIKWQLNTLRRIKQSSYPLCTLSRFSSKILLVIYIFIIQRNTVVEMIFVQQIVLCNR